jgi:hypothetical protein
MQWVDDVMRDCCQGCKVRTGAACWSSSKPFERRAPARTRRHRPPSTSSADGSTAAHVVISFARTAHRRRCVASERARTRRRPAKWRARAHRPSCRSSATRGPSASATAASPSAPKSVPRLRRSVAARRQRRWRLRRQRLWLRAARPLLALPQQRRHLRPPQATSSRHPRPRSPPRPPRRTLSASSAPYRWGLSSASRSRRPCSPCISGVPPPPRCCRGRFRPSPSPPAGTARDARCRTCSRRSKSTA